MTRAYSESLALWAAMASALVIMASPAAGLREATPEAQAGAAGRATSALPQRPIAASPAPPPPAAVPKTAAAPASAPPPLSGFACMPHESEASAAGHRAVPLGSFGRWSFRVVRCEPVAGGPAHLVAIDPATGRKRRLGTAQDLDRIDDALFADLALIARHPDRAARDAGTLVLRGPAGATCRIADSPSWETQAVEDCRLTHIDATVARADCRSGDQPSWSYVYHLRSGDTLVFAAGEAGMAEDGRILAGRFEFSGAHAPCPMTSANPDVYDGLVVISDAGFDLRDLSPQPPERAQPLAWLAADAVRYADSAGNAVCRRVQATTPQVLAIPCP